MTDAELIEMLRSSANRVVNYAGDRIEQLTAERDQSHQMRWEAADVFYKKLADSEADNARLLDHAVDLFRQVRIATYSGMAVRREIPAVQIQILADIDAAEFRAALIRKGDQP
jgi:class 3 adenylate cyclase